MKMETRKKQRQLETCQKVLRYIRNYWPYVAGSLFFAMVTVVLTLAVPVLTGKAVDLAVGAGQVDLAGIMNIVELTAVLITLTALAQWCMNLCNNRITYGVIRDIRSQAFARLQVLPLRYLDDHPAGEIVSRMIADVDQFADGLLMGFTQLFTGVLTILGTLVFMMSVHVGITLVVVLITPVSFLTAGFIARRTYAMFQLQSEARGRQTALIDEMIGNQKVVQAYGHEQAAMEQFDNINEELRRYSLQATFFSSITNPATRFVNGLVYAGVALAGALTVLSGGLTVGQLTCFLSYANQYTKPFNEISGVITELQNALACAARIFALMEEEPQTPDSPDARVLTDADGRVSLSHVWFSYTPEQKLIQDFNLTVRPGQRVAIVGPTGCGKSTVINLLMRFYDVDRGEICVSGTDVREITRSSLRTSYGMVLQETWLRAGTIRENLTMGNTKITEEKLTAAAMATKAHRFIRRLPDGYDTVISEDGGSLSLGQKQLLCITRVMLCHPPMLILDEATSSIDTRTEIQVQRAFAKLMEGRTSFIVAHRLSTIQNADVILVMKDGNIIEQGTHGQLLAQKGFYADLYQSQFCF